MNQKTVARKLVFLAKLAKAEREAYLLQLSQQPESEKPKDVQFDELESFERSKCLPLSIPLVVTSQERRILSFRVGAMPAKGPLALISRQKYGFRQDEREEMGHSVFSELRPVLNQNPFELKITSDQNPSYPSWIRSHFQKAHHVAVKARRGCVVGQGELKKIGFDPLFSLNHTCAMLRANINRLFRRTWCTTKRQDRLAAHLELYVQFHNSVLIE